MEIRRKVKNVVYKYSEAEKYVREATSNDPWGPTTTLMSEIADMTQNYAEYNAIMQLIWKRLNDKGKNWRHVYKSLILLDYLVKCGSDHVAEECLQNIHTIETLKDFQYFEDHKDLGIGIREKSKSLVTLLRDKEILDNERSKGLKVKEKFQGNKSAIGSHQNRKPGQLGREIRKQFTKDAPFPKTVMKLNFDDTKDDQEDEEFQRAIELSKEEHERSMKQKLEDERREDIKIKLALEQSKKEEEVLAVLRPPPKTSDKPSTETLLNKSTKIDSLYNLSEASRIFEQENGDLNSLDANYKSDPWGTVPAKSGAGTNNIPVDFDPWKSSSPNTNFSCSKSGPDIMWSSNTRNTNEHSRNIIDDIFGDDKPSTQFASNWHFDGATAATRSSDGVTKHSGNEHWLDSDDFYFTQTNKNVTGSLASLTDFDKNLSNGDKIQHSCSVMDLAESNITSNKKKTPQEFLGENANLVNLDNLVPVPKAAAKNPFGFTTPGMMNANPFNTATVTSKLPMNQLSAGNPPNASLFSSSGNLTSMGNYSQFNNYSPQIQPIFPVSHSQYQGFSNMNAYSNMPWSQPMGQIPNQLAINTNTANPFFN